MDRVILPACSRARGHAIDQFVSIIDTKGISMTDLMSKNVYNLMSTASKMAQDYYPELVARSFVINTPMLFSGFFSVIKPLLNSRTQQNLAVIGSNYIKEVTTLIPLASLPIVLGGTCQDPLDGKDHGFYAEEAQLCLDMKRWDAGQINTGMPGMPSFPQFPVIGTHSAGMPLMGGGPQFPGQPSNSK